MSREVEVCPHCQLTNWYRRTGGHGGRPAKTASTYYCYDCQTGFDELGTKQINGTTYSAAETLKRIGVDPSEAME